MKVLIGFLSAVCFLAGAGSAFADVPCEKCTHDMQVRYRKCLQDKRPQETCAKEQLEAAQLCVTICNPKPGHS